jgi:signal transduction histidine kinase
MKVEEFMQPEFSNRQITVENNFAVDLKTVHLDQNLFYRAFLNLFVNAVQAMPDGGTISVSTSISTTEKKKIVIMIRDTGIGIAEEKLSVIFTPFYTDKNRGTGLGLAIAKNIIEQHEGSITVESEVGKGSTFFITLDQY